MNLESLEIGQILSCRFTVGKPGLIFCRPPGLCAKDTGLKSALPGPGLSVAGPCGAIPLLCCTNLTIGSFEWFCPVAFVLLSGRSGFDALELLTGKFGFSALG